MPCAASFWITSVLLIGWVNRLRSELLLYEVLAQTPPPVEQGPVPG
jgi:hypothetical protein